MKKALKKLHSATEGMMALEGLIILTLVIFLLVFLTSFGFLLYQQWNVSLAANDTAMRIAQSYPFPQTDPVMGFQNEDMRADMSPYRYLFGSLEEKNRTKAEKYLRWSLSAGGLAAAVGQPDIEVTTSQDAMARRHVEVEVTARYEIPFGGVLEFFGMDGTVEYHAVGRAVCVDVSDYINTIDTLKAVTGESFGSKFIKTIDSVIGMIQDIARLFS